MPDSHAFRLAVERMDPDAVAATLAPDVVLHSPIVHKPYQGREIVRRILAGVMQVLTNFRYVAEYSSNDGHVLRFRARVGERDLEGIDLLTLDKEGLVADLTVMVRPYSAATALRDSMQALLG